MSSKAIANNISESDERSVLKVYSECFSSWKSFLKLLLKQQFTSETLHSQLGISYAPLRAEYTSISQSVSASLSLLVLLIVTYCPNKLGRQKKEAPCPLGTLKPPPQIGLVMPPSLDTGPDGENKQVNTLLEEQICSKP